MADRHFLTKAIERAERIDKQRLIRLVSDSTEEIQVLRDLLHALPDGILIVNGELKVIFLNISAERILGAPQPEKTNEPLSRTISDADLRRLIADSIRQNKEIYGEPFEMLSPRHREINLTIRQLEREKRSFDAKPLYAIILSIPDQTAGEAKERLQLEKLSSLLSLAAGIAHEIGNPLNSLNVHLQLLASDIKKLPKSIRGKLSQSIDIIMEETNRMDRIIRNFLKAIRRKPLQFRLESIHDILKGVLVFFEPEFKAHRIELVTSLDNAMPLFFIDSERLNHVFVNVIKNAVQAMPKGGQLKIATAVEKNICEVTIADTGSGIESNVLPRIFDAYYTTKVEGSGLGLAIAYQIIREHSGRIEVTSKLNRGTIVRILLPIRKEKLQLPSPTEKGNENEQYV